MGNFQWSAKLKITIVEAIGLLPKDNNGSSDPYCLVQGKDQAGTIFRSTSSKVGNKTQMILVGRTVKKTTTKKKTLSPTWNEPFDFKVDSARERNIF